MDQENLFIGTDTWIRQGGVVDNAPLKGIKAIIAIYDNKTDAFKHLELVQTSDIEVTDSGDIQVLMMIYKGMFSTTPPKKDRSSDDYDQ